MSVRINFLSLLSKKEAPFFKINILKNPSAHFSEPLPLTSREENYSLRSFRNNIKRGGRRAGKIKFSQPFLHAQQYA